MSRLPEPDVAAIWRGMDNDQLTRPDRRPGPGIPGQPVPNADRAPRVAEAATLARDILSQVTELESLRDRLSEQRQRALDEDMPEAAAQATAQLIRLPGAAFGCDDAPA